MGKFGYFVVPILAGFLVGYLGSLVQSDAITHWYPTLNKPPLTPPNAVFPIAWGSIYILSGISLGLILRSFTRYKAVLVALFIGQLILNFLWCFVFFYLRNPGLGMIVIIALLALLITYTALALRSKPWSAVLFIPYLLWVGFATYLNGYIWLHN